MMTYINRAKHHEMTENPDRHFKNKEVVNFDLIHHKCRGDPLKNTYKEYKTVKESNFENYLKKDEKKVLSSIFCNKRNNLWVQKEHMIKHFRENFK